MDLQAIEHLAKLAKLDLSQDQKELLLNQLPDIIKYMDVLNEVDTSDVAPTYQSTGLKNVLREDEYDASRNLGQSLLNHTEHDVVQDQIKVKSVFN